jgi:hypothetical protein
MFEETRKCLKKEYKGKIRGKVFWPLVHGTAFGILFFFGSDIGKSIVIGFIVYGLMILASRLNDLQYSPKRELKDPNENE